ncbi:MAG: drug/metabolite exporter YedA [Burkholderiales bacterium]|nr:drug/metabolite exporter YedA [Burkholderiales bacterium]
MNTLVRSAGAGLRRPGLPPLVLACLAATWLIWGSTYLAIKFALVSLPPFFQMGTRFLAAGALLAAWLRWRGTPWPDARQWRHAAIVGALMLGGGMGGTALAETTVASGLVVAFIAVGPMVLALFNLAFGVKPGRIEVAGMAVGLVGVLLLARGAGFAASPAGLVAQTVAITCWSLGSVLSQRRLPLAPGAMGFASEMLCGGALLMAMSWGAGETPAWPPTAGAVLAWVYLVTFGSLIAFNAYMVLLARASAAVASSYTYVNPVIAMALGVWLAGEQVSPGEWLATAVIVAGVVLLMAGRRAT